MMCHRLLSRPMHRLVHRPSRRVALAALLLCGMAGAPSLHAAPQVVDAEDLDLSVPCLGRFEIMVDPAMSDGVSIDSAPSNGAHLTMRTGKTQGSSKVLITSKACAPNAHVSILVAPNVGVMIHDSHDTHIVIHGTLASLEASLEAGQLDADTIQSLDLSLRGTEQVHIAHLNRAAQVVETGASGLVVDQADLDAFSAQLSETSHLSVTDGRFDVLTLMVENAASARLGGSVNTATVSATGTGLVAIPNVSGALTRTGNVQIGPGASAQAATPPATPPTTTVNSPQPVPAVPTPNDLPQAAAPAAVAPPPPATPPAGGVTVPPAPSVPSTRSTTPGNGVRDNAGDNPVGTPIPGTIPTGSGIPSQGLPVQNLPTQTSPTQIAPAQRAPAQAAPLPSASAPPSSSALPTDRSTALPNGPTGTAAMPSPSSAPARADMPSTGKAPTGTAKAATGLSSPGSSLSGGQPAPPTTATSTPSQPDPGSTARTQGDQNR